MTSSTSYTGTATLYWNMSTEPDLSGYRVWIGLATRDYFQTDSYAVSLTAGTTAAPAAFLTNIPNGVFTYATVTAFDLTGNESTWGEEVTLERQVPLIHLLRQFK